MKGNESMTAQEAARLMDWLLKNGHTPEEAIQCVNYIAGIPAPAKPGK